MAQKLHNLASSKNYYIKLDFFLVQDSDYSNLSKLSQHTINLATKGLIFKMLITSKFIDLAT